MKSVSAALMCAAQLSIELCTRLHVQLNISLSKILRMMGAMICYRLCAHSWALNFVHVQLWQCILQRILICWTIPISKIVMMMEAYTRERTIVQNSGLTSLKVYKCEMTMLTMKSSLNSAIKQYQNLLTFLFCFGIYYNRNYISR